MTCLKRIVPSLAALVLLLAASAAEARCAGTDMLPELTAADPDGVAAALARADAVPNASGLFWRIEKDGIAPSYLYGTYHSSDAIEIVPDAVWQRLDAADVAVFEMSREEQTKIQQRIASDPSFVIDMSAPPLLPALPEDKRAVLEDALQRRGVPVEAANFMRPWMLMSLLGMPACHVRGLMAGDQVMDDAMVARAEDSGTPVAGLETYEEALSGFRNLERQQLIEMILPTDDWADREEDFFAMLLNLYAAGEPVAINEISIYMSEKLNPDFDARGFNQALMADLLDRRNRAWMDDLLPHLQAGNAFVGVGALHLPGEVGLVALLRAEGWTVTRLD